MNTLFCDVAADLRLEIGESPIWDHRRDLILVVDIPNGELYEISLDGRVTVRGLGRTVGAVGLADDRDSLVLGTGDGVALWSQSAGIRRFGDLTLPPNVRMNDCQVGPDGSLWAGSMAWDATPGSGAVYRVLPSGQWTVAIEDVTISNGIGWTTSGETMFYIDSSAHSLDAFDVDSDGRLSNRRAIASIPAGLPDGLCVDDEDHIWVAVYGGGVVHRYSPMGELVSSVATPAKYATSCCFAGPDLDMLIITSASQGLEPPERHRQHAGAVFVADVGVRGRRANLFGDWPIRTT